MKLTREEALKLHRQMWSDMQEKLGDNPSYKDREDFKSKWIFKHFPNEDICNNCFLCEFCEDCTNGKECIIDWGFNALTNSYGCIDGKTSYETSPISKILALPEREINE